MRWLLALIQFDCFQKWGGTWIVCSVSISIPLENYRDPEMWTAEMRCPANLSTFAAQVPLQNVLFRGPIYPPKKIVALSHCSETTYKWLEAGSNRRHTDFQSVALPTELSSQRNSIDSSKALATFDFVIDAIECVGLCQFSHNRLLAVYERFSEC